MKRVISGLLLLTLAAALSACGGGKSTPPPAQITVAVSPATASVIAGQKQQFTATVSGTSNTAVSWSLSGAGCTGAACGSIDANGIYTAPSPIPASATVRVVATAAADASKQGTATVTHMPVAITVTPTSPTLISADTKQFAATVTNVPSGGSTSVTWSATGGGAIDSTGFYTAPAKVLVDTNVTVTATSQFDGTKASSVTLVIKAVVITVSPGTVAMEAGAAEQRFVATVTNAPAGQNGVTWSLSGFGTIDSSGMYRSPMLVAAPATDSIQAVPVFDTSKLATATVTLNPIVVTVTPETITLYSGQSQQFTATVANHVNKAVTWTVSGADCAGAACGTVDTNGLYTAPSSIANNMTVSINATAAADTSKSDPATVTLIPVSITISPKTATVGVNATKQFSATVAGSSNNNATWSVSASGCSGSACGTISTTGLYTAPATVPSSTVTVKATAVADPAKSDTATVTIASNQNSKLAGPYAFSYVGYDATGKALHAIGSFVADGNGSLSGLIDTNGNGAASLSLKTNFTGTYNVYPAGNRGEATFTVPGLPMTFRFSMNSAGEKGHMIRFDSSGSYGSGSFKRQTTSDFQLSKINGDYVLGLSGTSYVGDERNAGVGRLHTDGTGAISNTSMDVASTGEAPVNLTFGGNFALNTTTGAANGRGTIAVTVSGMGTLNFSFYLVNQNEAFMLSDDLTSLDKPLLSGSMLRQTGGPFSTTSVNGSSAFYLIGISMDNPRRSAVMTGQFTFFNGAGPVSYTYNIGGSGSFSGGYEATVTVQANGRGIWTSSVLGPHVFYLVAPNSGFHMDYSTPGTNVWFGFFEPQTGRPFYPNVFIGDFFGGTVLAPSSGLAYATGIETCDGNGGWTAIGDAAEYGIGLQAEMSSAGTYTLSSNTGRGEWLQTFPSTFGKAACAVSPDKILLMSTQPGVNPYLEILEK